MAQSIQRVYRDRAGPVEHRFEVAPAKPGSVTQIMSRTLICAHPALAADVLAEILVQSRVGCVPIVDKCGRPVGMVTKRDLVEQLLVVGPLSADPPSTASLLPRTARELMLPAFVTIPHDATLDQAAVVMTREGVHHLGVVDAQGRLIGVVSSMDIVRSLAGAAELSA